MTEILSIDLKCINYFNYSRNVSRLACCATWYYMSCSKITLMQTSLRCYLTWCQKPGSMMSQTGTERQLNCMSGVNATGEWPKGDALSAQNYWWGQCLCGHGAGFCCHAYLACVVTACWHCVGAKGRMVHSCLDETCVLKELSQDSFVHNEFC